jgi:hypothetical protein
MRIVIEDLGVPGVMAEDTIFMQPGLDPAEQYAVLRCLLPDAPAEELDAMLRIPV